MSVCLCSILLFHKLDCSVREILRKFQYCSHEKARKVIVNCLIKKSNIGIKCKSNAKTTIVDAGIETNDNPVTCEFSLLLTCAGTKEEFMSTEKFYNCALYINLAAR